MNKILGTTFHSAVTGCEYSVCLYNPAPVRQSAPGKEDGVKGETRVCTLD